MREKTIESKLVALCKKEGILCYKFTSPGNAGVPDRMLIFPNGLITFLELKAQGKKPTPKQTETLMRFRRQGVDATWLDNFKDVKERVQYWLAKDSSRIPSLYSPHTPV